MMPYHLRGVRHHLNNVREVVVKTLKVVIFIGYIWSESWLSCCWDELTPSACDFWFVLPCISSCWSIFAVVRYHCHAVFLLSAPINFIHPCHGLIPLARILHNSCPIIPVTAHLRVQICSAGWWFGTMEFYFLHWVISSSQLTNSIIFQRGRAQPPTEGIPYKSPLNPIKPIKITLNHHKETH